MITLRTALTPALLAGALVLGACSSSDPEPATPTDGATTESADAPDVAGAIELDGTDWRARAINGVPPASDQPTVVGFEGESISGMDGCNNFNGTYVLEGDQLSVPGPGFASTLMACEDPIGEQAATFTQILTGPATLVQSAEGELTVNAEAGTLVLQQED